MLASTRRTPTSDRREHRGACKSTDGGKTWVAFKGAPGGDDYQYRVDQPERHRHHLLVADQGAVVTLNGGETWSSWYNQPTAQMFHVTTDNAFPVPRLRRAAGQRLRVRREPRQRRRRSRFANGTPPRRGIRLRRARPVDPDIVYGGPRK